MIQKQVISVIGIDPGPTTGISFIDYVDRRIAGTMQLQVDGASAVALLDTVLARFYNSEVIIQRWGEVEAFVTGKGAGTKGDDAEVTRQLAFALGETLQVWGYHTEMRKAADVLKWGNDRHLKAAGVYREPTGMRHANAASAHGLYCAVHDAHLPSPLR